MAKKRQRTRKGPTPPVRRRPDPRSAHPPGPPLEDEPSLHLELVPGQVETLVGLIATGALDDHLPQLTHAIDRRHREIVTARSIRALGEFSVGDRVRVNRHIRPRYLQDATGTVTGWSGRRVVVHLDEATGRFGGGEVRVPPLGLERLARAA